MADTFTQQVYDYVSQIPAGKVTTYGAIAVALGNPRAARAIGTILKRNPLPFYRARRNDIKTRPHDKIVPCHRVVRADLKLGQYSGGPQLKAKLLKKEGVKINNGRVALQNLQKNLVI
jgi:methylated-DNA-[protein]-cysteine S-methyltransferase